MRRSLILIIVILYYLGILGIAARGEAKGWRGIVPLHSTRAQVEQLLGLPDASSNKFTSIYQLENESVLINYAGSSPCEFPDGWRVPHDTVVNIIVTPKTRLLLKDLQVDVSKYKKTSGGHRSEDVIYTNLEEGERITVYLDTVTSITYFPAAVDNHLRCTKMSDAANAARGTPAYPKLDSYHDIPFEDEKFHLDNFAINLLETEGLKGYIVAYSGRRTRIGEAQARAKRAKNYLVNVRGINATRIITIDGGCRDELTVEFYLVPPGAVLHYITPNVESKNIQILKDNNTKIDNRRSSQSRRKQRTPCQ